MAKLILAHVLYWLFKLATLILLAPLYISIIAEGFRLLIPVAGMRLSKIPFHSFLDDYVATHRLDIAHVMGLVLLLCVWLSWEALLGILLGGEIETWGFDPDRYKKAVMILATTLVVSDACFFYMAVSNSSWGASFNFASVIASAAYVAILVSVSFVSCILSRNIKLCSKQKETGNVASSH